MEMYREQPPVDGRCSGYNTTCFQRQPALDLWEISALMFSSYPWIPFSENFLVPC